VEREELEKLYWNVTDGGMPSNGIFGEYYGHLQQTFLRGIKECRHGREERVPELTPELLETYTKEMQRITLRTLIFEMEICEEGGKLKGATIEERYEYFGEMFLKDMDYIKEIYEVYPVLYERMIQTLENFIRNIDELLDRFAKDKEGINQKFYRENPCGKIRQIGGGSSDSHRHGQRVFILELDNGEKLVYKPRSLAVDEAYKAFLRWVFENVSMSYWWYRVWNREGYGWCQWVSSVSCSSHEELERYYYRNGMLLCVSYLLGSEDMHYENLIAHGEYPIIVDLEMVVGSRGTRMKRELTGTERFFQESVLQTGILPLYSWNEEGEGVNIEAINGKGGQLIPVVMPVVVNPKTVKMHIEYRRPVMGEGKNLAMLKGKFVEPFEFFEEIQKGFEKVYSFLVEHQLEVLEMLELFRSVPIRYLVRDTQQYSMLLMTLGHPDLLIKDPDRQAVWDVLERGIEHEESTGWILEQERQELLQGDVPYFYYTACKKELCSGTGGIWKEYFDDTAMQCIENRLKHMCNTDLERQEKLICGALLVGTKRVNGQKLERLGGIGISDRLVTNLNDKSSPLEENIEGRRIMAAEKMADILLKEAIWSEDGKEVGWISIAMAGYREKGYMIRPMNFYLYGGLAGVAVFMVELAIKTKREKYCDVGKVLVQSLFRHTEDLFQKEKREKLPTGAYCGEASIAFAYMLMYSASRNSIFLSYLRKQCQAVAEGLEDDKEYDVLGGNAGAILIFLKAYHLTGEEQYMVWAREAGDYLLQSASVYGYGMGWLNQAVGVALTGFAHGTAGIMLALVWLGHDVKEEKYLEAAYQAYRYEENYYREELQDWEDLRNEGLTVQESQMMAWCHGWGGIVMARMAAMSYVKGSFKIELEKTEDFVRRKANHIDTNLCLCHGRCGNTALLWKFGKKEEAVLIQSQLVEAICCGETSIQGLLGLQECENYGLLGGIAGIGYSCLCDLGKVSELLCIG